MARWERRDIPVRTLATGHELTIPVFHCHGKNERPLAYIQANVHGAELQGNAAVLALFDLLSETEPLGSLVLVPRVNPVSENQVFGDYVAGVYDFQTGMNFNRGYLYLTGPSRGSNEACYVDVSAFAASHAARPVAEIKPAFHEALRAALTAAREEAVTWGTDFRLEFALAIQQMAIEADLVLDLHTGDRAPRYLYIPEGAHDAARAFQIPFVLEVPHKFGGALDEAAFVPWQDLANAFTRTGRPEIGRLVDGFTVELGSMNAFSLAEGILDAGRIANALRFYGILPGPVAPPETSIFSCNVGDYRSIYTPASGLVDQAVKPGTAVRKGDVVARIADPSRCKTLPPSSREAIVEVTAPEDGIVILFHAFSSISRGARLLSMMTHVKPL